MWVESQLLQIDILTYVGNLFININGVWFRLSVHVFQHVGKGDESFFGVFGLGYDQCIERVQRIEEKMRVDL